MQYDSFIASYRRAKLSGELAITVKAGVKAAITVVSSESQIRGAVPTKHNLSVGLHCDAIRLLVRDGIRSEVGSEFAITVKAGVQVAIAGISNKREVVGARAVGVATEQNLAVGLHSDTLPKSI